MASPVVDQAIQVMTNAGTVDDAAIIFINAVPAMVQAAVDAALNNGATASQLQPVSDLAVTLQAKSDAVTAALTANTPTPPPTPVALAKLKATAAKIK